VKAAAHRNRIMILISDDAKDDMLLVAVAADYTLLDCCVLMLFRLV